MLDMRAGTCPICDHREIIEAVLVEFSGEHDQNARPLGITQATRRSWFFGGGPDPNDTRGILKQYVCRSCGHVQWFAERPGEIPIGDEHRTRLIRGPEATAYRR